MPTLRPNDIQTKLNREQKEAVGLLSIGTFLEYFDLMLYVHMAVLLNELFFPKTDPHVASLLAAFTFCLTYVFRPFGALLFGYIGDNMGRRHTIILTTALMAVCCCTMAVLPTYAEIGMTAAYIMVGCRIVQGMSSMGEVVGALLYLTEFVKVPARYSAVAMIPIFCGLGTFCALGLATFVTALGISWRAVFGFGALIAVVGIIARTALRETPEFADAVRRMKNVKSEFSNDDALIKSDIKNDKVSMKASLSLFLMECMWPLCFFFAFVYCAQILKVKFGYTSQDIIQHNFIVSLGEPVKGLIAMYLCRKFHPLKILKFQLIVSAIIYLSCPFLLDNIGSPFYLGMLQIVIIILSADSKFASSALYPHFPVFHRFKATAFLYALSRALTYVVTSFGMIFLVDLIGNWGILFAMMLAILASAYGLAHFSSLEKDALSSSFPKT